jgi:hypothetical protein
MRNTQAYFATELITVAKKYFIVKELYSQHFIFVITYELAQYGTVLIYTSRERLARDKHSSLLDPFVSYEENKLLLLFLHQKLLPPQLILQPSKLERLSMSVAYTLA